MLFDIFSSEFLILFYFSGYWYFPAENWIDYWNTIINLIWNYFNANLIKLVVTLRIIVATNVLKIGSKIDSKKEEDQGLKGRTKVKPGSTSKWINQIKFYMNIYYLIYKLLYRHILFKKLSWVF